MMESKINNSLSPKNWVTSLNGDDLCTVRSRTISDSATSSSVFSQNSEEAAVGASELCRSISRSGGGGGGNGYANPSSRQLTHHLKNGNGGLHRQLNESLQGRYVVGRLYFIFYNLSVSWGFFFEKKKKKFLKEQMASSGIMAYRYL